MIEGRVRRDNPPNFIFLAGRHELVQFIRPKIWRNFHKHRLRVFPIFIANRAQ